MQYIFIIQSNFYLFLRSKEILKTKRSEIKYLIWDYIDKNDGVKYDI